MLIKITHYMIADGSHCQMAKHAMPTAFLTNQITIIRIPQPPLQQIILPTSTRYFCLYFKIQNHERILRRKHDNDIFLDTHMNSFIREV